ncbi:hypothetical protein J1P26_22055 [Neobacillus sp. MM2021_6]|uniref:hypothetical protein n=1 Tax=Bacillaceae TaxID=186817 RepID=UPI00140DBE35|nr:MULTISPECIES: hypothetical protein [Bacillaceae]MBO0962389.1 hypothetical protein [Neobacillus sp. MM2021_6]NHC21042.1 hypothetical protein [Bacillus sp. MM2020_4]
MNYILLELDTTAPTLEIYAPNYTTRSALTPVTIQANEPLSSYQEVYIVDALGGRHDLTFAHEDDNLVGYLSLNGYPLGIATLYCRLMDTVDNLSSLYSHSFSIMESEILTAEMSLQFMDNAMQVQTMNQDFQVNTMKNEMEVVS